MYAGIIRISSNDPIKVIHLKRFQPLNGRWCKSHAAVRFPFVGFDPYAFVPSHSQRTLASLSRHSSHSARTLTLMQPAMDDPGELGEACAHPVVHTTSTTSTISHTSTTSYTSTTTAASHTSTTSTASTLGTCTETNAPENLVDGQQKGQSTADGLEWQSPIDGQILEDPIDGLVVESPIDGRVLENPLDGCNQKSPVGEHAVHMAIDGETRQTGQPKDETLTTAQIDGHAFDDSDAHPKYNLFAMTVCCFC